MRCMCTVCTHAVFRSRASNGKVLESYLALLLRVDRAFYTELLLVSNSVERQSGVVAVGCCPRHLHGLLRCQLRRLNELGRTYCCSGAPIACSGAPHQSSMPIRARSAASRRLCVLPPRSRRHRVKRSRE